MIESYTFEEVKTSLVYDLNFIL